MPRTKTLVYRKGSKLHRARKEYLGSKEVYRKEDFRRDIYRAFYKARKGKRGTIDELKFELYLWDNLEDLITEIWCRLYKPSPGICFITFWPVIREIFGAPFRDRVVHHYLFDIVEPWWERHFIYGACSCRKGKGNLFAINLAERYIRSVSDNFRRPTYVCKFDLKGYFMSMDRKKLYECAMWGLDRQYPKGERGVKYYICRYLWRQIIFDNPTEGVKRRGGKKEWSKLPKSKSLFTQPPGRGIVIGNLTSQLLSNILLNEFDRYVTMELGYKHYVRYVDDFLIVVLEEDLPRLQADVRKFEKFLKKELGLTLHPNKRYFQEVHKGVEFVGARIYAGYKLPSKRIEKSFYRAMAGYVKYPRKDSRYDEETIISYLGMMKHFKSERIIYRGCKVAGIGHQGLKRAQAKGGKAVAEYLMRERARIRRSAGRAQNAAQTGTA